MLTDVSFPINLKEFVSFIEILLNNSPNTENTKIIIATRTSNTDYTMHIPMNYTYIIVYSNSEYHDKESILSAF